MFVRSKPYPEMIKLFAQLKVRHRLKIAAVSNEGRDLNAYRIRKRHSRNERGEKYN